MPDFTITDPQTGKKWILNGAAPPSPSMTEQLIHQLRPQPMASHATVQADPGPYLRAQTPLGIMGAPRGAMTAALGSLIDQPNAPNKIGMMARAAGHELMQIGAGAKPTEPSEGLKKRGVYVSPAGGVVADSMVDPLNALTGGDDAIVGGIKGVLEHGPELLSTTAHLYTSLINEVLPIMNKPETPRVILAMIERAGAGVAAKLSGFSEWLTAQGSKALSRAQVVGRLLREPEFRQILMEHAHPLVRPAVIGGDYVDRKAKEGDITAPSAMTKLILSMAPFLATATGTVQEPDVFGDTGEMIDDVTELPSTVNGERKKSGDPIRYDGD